MSKIKKNIDVDIVGSRSLEEHYNIVWSSGVSPWKFTRDSIVSTKKSILLPIFDNIDSVLDLGCGGGEFLSFVLEGSDVRGGIYKVGVDIAELAVINARNLKLYDELFTEDIQKFLIGCDRAFDLIMLNEVLYYQKDYIKILSMMNIKIGGYLFLSVAMGDDFFNNKDLLKIKKKLSENYNLVAEKKINYTIYKIPWKWIKNCIPWIKASQTHKIIFIFQKK